MNSKLKCQNTSKWKTNNINLPKADWPLYKQQCWLCKHGYTHYAYIHEYAHFTNMYILRSTSIVYTQWIDLRRSYTIYEYNMHVTYIAAYIYIVWGVSIFCILYTITLWHAKHVFLKIFRIKWCTYVAVWLRVN